MMEPPVSRDAASLSKKNSFYESEIAMNDEMLFEIFGFNINDTISIERAIFTAINEGNRAFLIQIFDLIPSSTTLLQILLTTTYPNRDEFYKHDPEDIHDANELLGSNLEHLNALQIACILGEEDIALDILDFVTRITEEIEAKKVLYEFMGRVWGDGNTPLHLASFMGMSDLVTKMIELGAATSKVNNRKYKPVDCAGDDLTRMAFETVTEVNRSIRKASNNSLSTSDILLPFSQEKDRTILFDRNSISSIDSVSSEPCPVMKQNSMSESIVTSKKSRSSSNPKSRSTRASTFSGLGFQASQLSRSRDSSVSSLQKPKKNKSVRFDPVTTLLHMCQYVESTSSHLDSIKKCLEDIKSYKKEDELDINNVYLPQQWLTPLHIACSHGHVDVVKLLLDSGAAVNITDREGWTPLHCASAEGHINIIALLGQCQGNSASDDKSDPNIIYVLDGPIDLQPLNNENETPLDVALENKLDEIRSLFNELYSKYPSTSVLLDEELFDSEDDEEDLREKEVIVQHNSEMRRTISVMKPSFRHDHHKKEREDENIHHKVFSEIVKNDTILTTVDNKIPSKQTLCEVDFKSIENKLPEMSKGNIPLSKIPSYVRTDIHIPTIIENAVSNDSGNIEIVISSDMVVGLNSKESKNTPDNNDLLSPVESTPGTANDTKKVRRANSTSRTKKELPAVNPSDFEVKRTLYVGELMRRPSELQRKTSKSLKCGVTSKQISESELPPIHSQEDVKKPFNSLSEIAQEMNSSESVKKESFVGSSNSVKNMIKIFQEQTQNTKDAKSGKLER